MKKIKFTLPAEALGNATEAFLLGDFNEWKLENAVGLRVQSNGTLAASVELEPGKSYEYKFYLNNGTWLNDHSANQYINNAFGAENSIVNVPADVAVVAEKVVATEKVVAKKVKAVASKEKAKTKKEAAPVAAPKAKKEKVEVPAKDDLTKIEGIGSKIAKLLEADGIVSFADLAKATSKKLKGILEAAGPKFQLHDPATWPKQAKLAAAKKWDELTALQEKLVGGK